MPSPSAIVNTLSGDDECIPSVAEYPALVMDEVNEDDLLRGAAPLGDATGRGLPVRRVKLPVDDLSQIAVLSWRWDGNLQGLGSRNVSSAIRQAKQMGIRYLFVDVISIDQQLRGDALIEQVAAFSKLYKTIPVIATYDKVGENFEQIMRRPWIMSEARLFRYNPTRIIYVGHNDQGAKHKGDCSPLGEPLLGKRLWRFNFGEMLGCIWASNFVRTILLVLCDEIGMSSVSDFKFIIPAYSRVLAAAFEKMTRNDYLLTAAILCGAYEPTRKLWSDITALKFDQYNFSLITNPPDYGSSWTVKGIFLNGTKIAHWEQKYNMIYDYEWYIFRTLPNSERVIFTALGMTDSDYREFVAREQTRHACLHLSEDKSSAPLPQVEIVSVRL